MKIILAAILISVSANNQIAPPLPATEEFAFSSSDILRSVESERPSLNYNLAPLWYVASPKLSDNDIDQQSRELTRSIFESRVLHYQNIALELQHIHSP